MLYVYLRVSTDKQDEDSQKVGIDRWLDYKQWKADEYVIEHGVSGAKDYKKRLLGRLIEKLKSGDWLIVSEFTRLSRDTFQMYEICKTLVDNGVSVFSVKDNQILDLSADGKFRLAMYCYFAEKERERISVRTKEGLARVKNQGKHVGRPFGTRHAYMKLQHCEEYIRQLVDENISVNEMARRFNTSPSNMRRYLDNHGLVTERQLKARKIHDYDKYKQKARKTKENKTVILLGVI